MPSMIGLDNMGLLSSKYVVNQHNDDDGDVHLDDVSVRMSETCFSHNLWCYMRKNKDESTFNENTTNELLQTYDHIRAINNEYMTPRASYTALINNDHNSKLENLENDLQNSNTFFNISDYLIKRENMRIEEECSEQNSTIASQKSHCSILTSSLEEANHFLSINDTRPTTDTCTSTDFVHNMPDILNMDTHFNMLDKRSYENQLVHDGGSNSNQGHCRVYSKQKGKKSAMFSFQQKYEKVITEDKSVNFPIYKMSNETTMPNHHNDRTWDVISQGFRVALSTDNFFICDSFLGSSSTFALHELHAIRDTYIFDQHMVNNPSLNYKYSNFYLSGENENHKYLDKLTLLVYKLAKQFSSQPITVSVELTYFPEGHSTLVASPDKSQKNIRLIKCIYFPNEDWSSRIDLSSSEVCGKIYIETSRQPLTFEPIFDRLVLFWGDYHSQITLNNPYETFSVVIWIIIQNEDIT